MSKHFFRKVAFGLDVTDTPPNNPLDWAKAQVKEIPKNSWDAVLLETELHGARLAGQYSGERKIINKKFKKDKKKRRSMIRALEAKVGWEFHESMELSARHHTCLRDANPVFERFLMFWGNHFAISKKFFLAEFTVGAYQRTILRPLMTGSFTDLVEAATKSWSMMELLDNGLSVGPKSKHGKNDKTATLNENHGRELLELHTVSPASGYDQGDVTEMTLAMTGWRKVGKKKYGTKRFTKIGFDKNKHEPGPRTVLGKTYKASSHGKQLRRIIEDLAAHEETLRFVSTKLCRHFITDHPTDEMIDYVVTAWRESQGSLISIHSAVLDMAYKYAGTHKKFQQPENWLLQVAKLSGAPWPSNARTMASHDFNGRPSKEHTVTRDYLTELGQRPYQPAQPDGYSDVESSWVSPEYLIRRIGIIGPLLRRGRLKTKRIASTISTTEQLETVIRLNFDNHGEILNFLREFPETDRLKMLLTSKWMLKV